MQERCGENGQGRHMVVDKGLEPVSETPPSDLVEANIDVT